jgi:glyoxylase-like metal-dependent hydrolase (beta-lactamase superfamily II)
MLKLHVVQAQFGDCLILEFGTAGKSRFVLIDGGPAGNYDANLKTALKDIVGSGGKLDLLVLSHIDNDHAVGVLDLLAAIEDDVASERDARTRVAALWLNSFARSIDPPGEISQRL